MRRDVLVIWYARCPKCRLVFIGTTEKQARYRALEHMRHRHGTENAEIQLKSAEVTLE